MTHDQAAKAEHNRPQAGKPMRFGLRLSLILGPLALLVPSCAPNDFGSNDPLFGMPAVRPPNTAVVGPASPSPGGLPPFPATPPSENPAGLTSSGRGPLDPTRPDLRIGGADSGTPAWQGSAGGTGGVALQPPQPLGSGGAVPLQPAAQLTGNATTPTYEQLRAQLVKRGVSLVTITTNYETGETTLMCQVPKSGSPNVHQTYQTRARDEVSALQAILDQLSKDQH